MKVCVRNSLRLLAVLALSLPVISHSFTLNAGDILISNHTGNNVQRLDPITGIVTTLTTISNTPIGLAFDTSFNLYINSGNGIQRLDRQTDTLSTFFTGTGQREGLTFDPTTGHLFSVSFGANRIEEVDLSGNLVRTIAIPGTSQLLGITARAGQLVVGDLGTGHIFLGTTTGSSFAQIGGLSAGNTYAVDIDGAGNIYANDFALNKTVKFTPAGGGIYTPSNFITGLSAPANGLSIGDDGSLTISEFSGNAISVWNSDGTLRRRYTGVASPDELVVFAPARQNPIPGVPEPETYAMLLAGLVLLGFVARRRRQEAFAGI
jgi:sugar lactone lactonase YvrE